MCLLVVARCRRIRRPRGAAAWRRRRRRISQIPRGIAVARLQHHRNDGDDVTVVVKQGLSVQQCIDSTHGAGEQLAVPSARSPCCNDQGTCKIHQYTWSHPGLAARIPVPRSVARCRPLVPAAWFGACTQASKRRGRASSQHPIRGSVTPSEAGIHRKIASTREHAEGSLARLLRCRLCEPKKVPTDIAAMQVDPGSGTRQH